MKDFDDQDDGNESETDEEALAASMALIRGRGVRAAVDAAIDVLEDKKAPAQARAAMANSMLRAGGMFDRKAEDDDEDPAEMSAADLAKHIRRLEQDAARIKRSLRGEDEPDDEDEDPGVMG